MIRMANDADYALTYFATMAAGYVALPSSAQLTAAEAAYLLETSGAAAVAASAELAASLQLPEGVMLLAPPGLAALKQSAPLEIGRAHFRTPVTNATLGCRILLEK